MPKSKAKLALLKTMAFVRRRNRNGVNYYSLVENQRLEGSKYPKQVQLAWLGNYQQAVEAVSKLRRLSADTKQQYLTQLAVLEGLLGSGEFPFPTQHFSCIVVDPPWFYHLRPEDRSHRNRIDYPPMTLQEILKLPIPALSAFTGCYLWLWTTNNHMADANECLRQWGFELKTILTWEKITKSGDTRIGTGHYLRNATEHCLVATKGNVRSFGPTGTKTLSNQPSILHAPRREHSRKPEEFYELVETLCPEATKLELFARQSRPGWHSWGNEVSKFDELNCSANSKSLIGTTT